MKKSDHDDDEAAISIVLLYYDCANAMNVPLFFQLCPLDVILLAVSVALFEALDCFIIASKLSICCCISGDLPRRSSLQMHVSRCL
jgi:hypothetical protein